MFIKKVVTPVVIVASSIGAMAIPSISVAAHADEIAAFSGPLPMNQTFDPRMNVPTPAYRDPRETRRAPTYQTSVVPPLPSFPVMPQSGYGSPPFVPSPAPTVPSTPRSYDEPRTSYHGPATMRHAPPAPRHESAPVARRGFIFVPGFWDVQGHRFVWVDGHFVRERRGYAFQPQRWEHRGDGWFLNRARFDRLGGRFANQFDRDGDRVPDRIDREPFNPRRF